MFLLQNLAHKKLMTNPHRFRYSVGAVMQKAITWANVDSHLGHHMESIVHKEFKDTVPFSPQNLYYVLNVITSEVTIT